MEMNMRISNFEQWQRQCVAETPADARLECPVCDGEDAGYCFTIRRKEMVVVPLLLAMGQLKSSRKYF